MNKLIYQSQKIQKTLYCQNGVIESVEYRNLLTGNVYSSNSEDVSVKYRRGCDKKAKVVTKADMTLQNADEKGYKLVCKDGSFLLEVSYISGKQGVLYKKIVLKAKEDIFIEYADLQTFDCGNIAFVWQAPYAGKTYLPQSIARLGQPLYLGDMFIGTESPVGENAIGADKAYCRYNTGRKLSEVCENLVYELPMQIVGVGSADNFVAMRKAFFEYIESISRPFRLRLQFNSWYDNMLDITPERIEKSFKQVYEGLKDTGLRPLDCYVVDDGWAEYKKPVFWEFNDKFKDGFANEAKLTQSLGSKFGVWFGPRGGYTSQTVKFARLLKKIGYHVNTKSRDICTADKRYISDLCDKMAEFCRKYNVDYFKIDGFAKEPCKKSNHNHIKAKGEGLAFYTYFWEEWIKGFEKIRRVQPDVCLNITSYVHCSPWFLKWVDFIWMNNASDMGYVGKGNDLSMCLNYRDERYRNFYEDRQLQFPACHLYNHEPCYALRNYNVSRPWQKNKPVVYTDEEFALYLKACMMRGSGIIELYFSPAMMNKKKWQTTCDILKWTEKNFELLSTSQFFGGRPDKGEVYGYYACRDGKYIIMLRNSGDKIIPYEFDLLGIGKIQGILKPFEIKFIEEI